VCPRRRRSFEKSPLVGASREEALSERFLGEPESDQRVGIARILADDAPENRRRFPEPSSLRAQMQERSIRARAGRASSHGGGEQVQGALLLAELRERGGEAVEPARVLLRSSVRFEELLGELLEPPALASRLDREGVGGAGLRVRGQASLHEPLCYRAPPSVHRLEEGSVLGRETVEIEGRGRARGRRRIAERSAREQDQERYGGDLDGVEGHEVFTGSDIRGRPGNDVESPEFSPGGTSR
jgi:hypothetical protein